MMPRVRDRVGAGLQHGTDPHQRAPIAPCAMPTALASWDTTSAAVNRRCTRG